MKKYISSENLFYFAWILMVMHFCVANSNLYSYNISIISYISIIIFGLAIIMQKSINWFDILLVVLFCSYGIFAYLSSKDMRVFWFAIVLCASKEIDFDKAVKYSFNVTVICCLFFLGFYILGLSEETIMINSRGVRHSLGLGHPNMCSAYYMMLMNLYMYLKSGSINIKKIILFTFGSIIIFLITKSITGLFTSIFSLVIVTIYKYCSAKKMFLWIIVLALICGIVFFTLIPIIYNNHFEILDKLMTGRLSQAHFFYEEYGINLLGNDFDIILTSKNTTYILDIGYSKMLFNNGLIYYMTVILGYVFTLFRAIEDERFDIIILIAFFIVYMFTENVSTYIFMNVSMLLFTCYLFDRKSCEKWRLKLYERFKNSKQ
ncbi:hypothetical protein [Floccifex sp.]|uniref:hypothetical protein n=1 Tax=Floccifex sp. TaxID=2815810 RepID=UPI003F09C906